MRLLAITMVALLVPATLAGQTRWRSASLVGLTYQTGNEFNCPTGVGLGVDAEAHTRGRVSVGLAGGIRLATAYVCTLVLPIRPVNGRYYAVYSDLSLIAAPLAVITAGSEFIAGGVTVSPRLRAGGVWAAVDTPDATDERRLLSLGQFEIGLGSGRFGVIARVGAIRSVVLLEAIEAGAGPASIREHHWRRITEIGVALRW